MTGSVTPYVKPSWREEGPGPLSLPMDAYSIAAGAIEALAIDPLNSDRIFVATVGGGVWYSYDAISAMIPTWTPLTDFAPSLSMSAIAFDPNDTSGNTLFAGCAMTSNAEPLVGPKVGPLFGLLKTSDGVTWKEIARNTFLGQDI